MNPGLIYTISSLPLLSPTYASGHPGFTHRTALQGQKRLIPDLRPRVLVDEDPAQRMHPLRVVIAQVTAFQSVVRCDTEL